MDVTMIGVAALVVLWIVAVVIIEARHANRRRSRKKA